MTDIEKPIEETRTADEQSKADVADKVVTFKRKYFFPATGTSVEAESHEEAIAVYEKQLTEKDGDAN
jgi:hypothetical protein